MESQAEILEWVAYLFSDLPRPGVEPGSPAMHSVFLPTEPMRKPILKNLKKTQTQLRWNSKAFPFKSRLDMDLGLEANSKWRLHLGVPCIRLPGVPPSHHSHYPQEGAVLLPDTHKSDPPHPTQTVQLQTTGLDRNYKNVLSELCLGHTCTPMADSCWGLTENDKIL